MKRSNGLLLVVLAAAIVWLIVRITIPVRSIPTVPRRATHPPPPTASADRPAAQPTENECLEKVLDAMAGNDLPKAKKLAQTGLTLYPKCVNLLINLALIDFSLGAYDTALAHADQALVLDAYVPDAHYLKGLIFEKMGKPEDARREFVAEINLHPGSRPAWKKIKELGYEKK